MFYTNLFSSLGEFQMPKSPLCSNTQGNEGDGNGTDGNVILQYQKVQNVVGVAASGQQSEPEWLTSLEKMIDEKISKICLANTFEWVNILSQRSHIDR